MSDKKTLSYYTAELRRIEESRQADTEKEVKKIYKEILKDLNSFLGNEYATYSDGDGVLSVAVLQEKARYAKFLQEVDQHLNSITPKVSKTIQSTVEDTYKTVYTGVVNAVEKSVDSDDIKEKLKGLSLRPEVMKRAVQNPVSGLTLPDTLEKHRKEVIYNIKQQINIGLMTGERYDTMAKNVKKVIAGDDGRGGSYGKAMNIVRTEVHRVQESGMMDCAEDISPSLEGSGLIYTATWRNMGDANVRPSYRVHTSKGWKTVIRKTTANHQKMEGVTIRVGDKFDLGNGVFAKCPGSSGTPENDCRCRCFLEYELMSVEEFAKATGKTVDEVKKEFGIVDKPKKEYLTKKKLQENISNADVELDNLYNEFEFASGGFTYKEIKEKYPKGLSDFAKGKKLDTLNGIQSKIENVEAQKSEWQTKLDKKLIAEKKKTLTKEQIKLQEQLQNYQVKTYSGIWKNDVTTADWKNLNIQGKKDYYENQIFSGKAGDKLQQFNEYLKQLEELDIEGKAYHDIKSQLAKVEKDLTNLKNSGIINKTNDAFSQERKDAALWAKNTKEADNALRDVCGDVWKNAPKAEKDAIYEYTSSYSKFNEPLRGIEYGTNEVKGVGNIDFDTIGTNYGGYKRGKVRKQINTMTDIIEKSTYDFDIWLQRGCDYSGMDNLFEISMSDLQNATQTELERLLIGKVVTDYGFFSCGVSKGKGFSHKPIIMNVYAPKGTKMMYAEPFSAFGNGSGRSWDGVSKQSSFGNESEIILQQGTSFRVTKVERTNGKLYIDIEVIMQNKLQR